MKKSMIGMNAPASRMSTPNGCSPPASVAALAEGDPELARAGPRVVVMAPPEILK